MSETAGIETETRPGIIYRGVIALEWPAPRPRCGPMPGWGVSVFDALNGKQITTVTRLELHASASDAVTADLTMFADEDGQPVYTGRPHMRDGEMLHGTFPFLVAEMRVKQAEPPRGALEPRFLTEPCGAS